MKRICRHQQCTRRPSNPKCVLDNMQRVENLETMDQMSFWVMNYYGIVDFMDSMVQRFNYRMPIHDKYQ